jgi:ABC-type uncharacterized transport system permease subunit
MNCNINRSINVGLLTTVVMSVIMVLWIGIENIKNSSITIPQVVLLVAVLFVISTSMDYFNQCYTLCDNMKSSLIYGVFVVALIYLFYSLFITPIKLNINNGVIVLVNVILLGMLHNVTCKIDRREYNY